MGKGILLGIICHAIIYGFFTFLTVISNLTEVATVTFDPLEFLYDTANFVTIDCSDVDSLDREIQELKEIIRSFGALENKIVDLEFRIEELKDKLRDLGIPEREFRNLDIPKPPIQANLTNLIFLDDIPKIIDMQFQIEYLELITKVLEDKIRDCELNIPKDELHDYLSVGVFCVMVAVKVWILVHIIF